jgi:uncharacterized protein
MKVVIDTNVVISAAMKDRLPEEVILFVVETEDISWIASPEILSEYTDVLQRPKFALPSEVIARWQATFESSVTVIDSTLNVDFPRDRRDAKFLSCALAVDAEYLITGDKNFRCQENRPHDHPVSFTVQGACMRRLVSRCPYR